MDIQRGGAGNGLAQILFNVKAPPYRAVGDDSADDKTAINAAIAAANAIATGDSAGAVVYFPPGRYAHSGTLTTPGPNVRLLGPNTKTSNGYNSAAALVNTVNSVPSFDLGNAATVGVIFEGIAILGAGGTNLAHRGVTAASLSNSDFRNVMFDNFGGSAVRIDGGADNHFFDLYVTNCLLGYASLTGFAGVIELGASESFGYRSNINGVAGVGAHSNYGSGYLCALYVKNSLAHWYNTTFAFAQTGVRVSDIYAGHEFAHCRFEYNQGRGLWFGGSKSRLIGNRFQDNSQDADGAYPHLQIGTAGALAGYQNVIMGNEFDAIVYDTYQPNYGIEMQAGNSPAWTLANHVLGNGGSGFRTALLHLAASNVPPVVTSAKQYVQSLTGVGTQTFDGQQGDTWFLTVNANTTTTVAATNLIYGHEYNLAIYNASGAAPAINLDTPFRTGGYTAPANGQVRSIRVWYDGVHLLGIGPWSGDF